MKIDRLMAIIVIMLNRDKVTAKELSEKFEVSVRTIYRDIDTIDLAGIPIVAYPGNNGGYGIMENYKLDHQLLTLSNLYSLLTTLQGINLTLKDDELDTSIEKLKTMVPSGQTQNLDLQLEQLIIDMPSWAKTSEQNKMVKKLRRAISHSSLITVQYKNVNNSITTRILEPMSIIFKGYTWHLFAYCRLKNDFRVFRISRISDLEITDQTFMRQDKSYLGYEEESKKQDTLISITLRFSKEMRTRVEDIFRKEEISESPSGDILVTSLFPEQDWYYSLILSFGDHVEVISPEEVRRTVALKAKKMFEKYK